jgi:excisionase family DNA binding protein
MTDKRKSFRNDLGNNLAGLEPLLVPVSQASATLCICQRSIYELMASGELKAAKIGRRTLVVYESLKEYSAKQSAPKLKRYVPKGARQAEVAALSGR